MSLLWSRAAKARSSCSCRSCFHTATNLARRTTTAVGKRQIKASDVFTACYSTILATAAVADMRIKDERRKEWDRVIAEARDGTPTNDSSGCMEKLKKTGSRHEESETEQLLHETMFYPEAKPDADLQIREPTKVIHLERMQGMIARLVFKFLEESTIFSEAGIKGDAETQRQALQVKELIQSLMEGFSDLPAYQYNDVREIKDQRDELNRSLYTICRSTKGNYRPSVNLMLAKISYNLLVSTSPPNTETYDLLVAEFSRLGNFHLAQIVVNSFMHESKLKPSRYTTKLILDHYEGKGDPKGHRSIVKRMRCTRKVPIDKPISSPDMRIGMRWLRDSVHPNVRKWALAHDTIHRNGALHAKAPRDAAIFDSQIMGGLKFHGLQAATREIRSAFRHKRPVHQDTLCAVLRVCIDQASFGDGLTLIRSILDVWVRDIGHLITVYSDDLRRLIYQLLAMCGIESSLNSKQHLRINLIKHLPLRCSVEALQDLLHHMHLESISDALDSCSKFTSAMSQSLGLKASYEAGDFQSQGSLAALPKPDIDLAMRIIEDYANEQQVRLSNQSKLEIDSRWSRLQVLEGRINARRSEIVALELQLTSFLNNMLPVDGSLAQTELLSPGTQVARDDRLLSPRKLDPSASAQEVALVDQSSLPKIREVSISVKESSRRPTNGATLRPATPALKPYKAPFPIPLSLSTMRDKVELEAAAS
ncbi:hypothetical protein VTL71DRAFT_15202 [Oculimacula yallundae]|uniref:Pentatricopeptide repeat domain-containing protein n=1 Tax=Oculimacula yallundae TaxID=86028 RepID=A0ABR4CGI8_9HELO